MELTGEICDVNPFLESYQPVQHIPVARCCTVWTNQEDGNEHLLVGDQMLWFGTSLPNSLINPNQLRAYGHDINDDPFNSTRDFGIDTDNVFIPFDTTGTVVHFESRVPTEWEKTHLPVILLTGEQWNPMEEVLRPWESRENKEMRTIKSLTSGMTRRQINAARKEENTKVQFEQYGEVEMQLGQISNTHIAKDFCNHLISAVNIATTYREDVDKWIDERKVSSVVTNDRHSKATPEELARKWNIGIQTAKDTIQVTTQRGIRTAIHPMTRRVRVDHLHLHRNRLKGTWYADTLLSKVKSKLGNTCANVYTQGKFTRAIPMTSRKDAGKSLIDFTDDVGIPERLVTDGATEFTGRHTEFVKEARRMRIILHTTEQGRKNQNHAAEREIGFLAKRWKLRMTKKKVPRRLWDFGLVYESELLSRMARGSDRRTGYEEVTGQTPDISEWLDFEFYDLVWWLDRPVKPNFTDYTRRLARWLGVSHRVGSDLSYWLITEGGKIISKTSVEHVTRDDYLQVDKKAEIDEFNERLEESLNDENFVVEGEGEFDSMYLEDIDDDTNAGVIREEDLHSTPSVDDYGDMHVDDRPEDDDEEAIDKYLNAELIMNVGTNDERRGRVIKRTRGPDGERIGRAHANPLFDTREYEVEFTDGTHEKYQANIIAENMYAQVDSEGNQYLMLQEIMDHKKDSSAIPISEGTVRSSNGQLKAKPTTRGWFFLVQWRDGSSSWEKLKDLKASNPVEVAEYAVVNRIVEEPAFKWWVPHVIRRRNRIISKVKSRYWTTTHKFGIRLPKSVEEALEIDRNTNTDFWRKAINKEMAKVKIAWQVNEKYAPQQIREGKAPEFIGFQEIGCHIVFDIKMDFTRKARFVAGGHTTTAPTSMTYSSVVSRDSVRLAFLIAALNDLDIMSCDLENAYLNAPCREKIWFEGGIECGEDQGKVCVVVRSLYGLKSAGAAFRSSLAQIIQDLGYESSKADPDVWIRKAVRNDGHDYYEMLFVYVDDILALSHKAKDIIKEITTFYKAKEGSIKPPELYLGANISKMQLPDGREVWTTSPRAYVKNSLIVIERLLEEDGEGYVLKSNARNPFPTGYKPEIDITEELDQKLTSRYMQLIGILRWAVEIGRIDIFLEVSLLSQYQANPRFGHLEAIYHIFAYLKKHPDMGRLAYDSRRPDIDERIFHHNADWKEFYGDVEEELPPNMPEPRGHSVTISAFVDANHAGNVVTRRSHTGIFLFVQNAPIIWFSKRQNTVEAATFGSEFVALRICKELIVALRYKLRMFGVPIDGPANVFCDNRGVVKNVSIPESTLMKKHNAINYHAVREAAAAGILRVGKEDGETNLADLLTKVLSGEKRWNICWNIMW
jgi:Reverse transcriptase (RNA-dependent DNA polymerase)